MCAAADAASFRPAQIGATFHPLSFDAAQASAFPAAADAASYALSVDAVQASAAAYYAAYSNAAQASVASYPPFFDATQPSVIPYPTSLTAAHWQADVGVQADPAAVDYYGIPEDAKIISTKDDEQVDFVAEATANAPITLKDMVVEDGKDIEIIETKSLPTRSSDAQSWKSNKKEDGDVTDGSAPC